MVRPERAPGPSAVPIVEFLTHITGSESGVVAVQFLRSTDGDLNQQAATIIAVRDRLSKAQGDPVYSPFIKHQKGVLSAEQA